MNNRRKFSRIPTDIPCDVKFRNHENQAFVANESIEGICIAGITINTPVQVGETIEVKFHDQTMLGICHSLSRLSGNMFQIGAVRVDEFDSSKSYSESLLSHFVKFQSTYLRCEILDQDGERYQIRLINGKELITSNVRAFTQSERSEQLADEEELNKVCDIYGLLDSELAFETLGEIVAYEFKKEDFTTWSPTQTSNQEESPKIRYTRRILN